MNPFSELWDPVHAINYLGKKLKEGELVLFLGAGASSSFGLPGWNYLVNQIREELKLSPVDEKCSAEDLQAAADECEIKFRDKNAFRELVRKHLYSTLPTVLNVDVFSNKLLLSLSAMLMGSSRGHVSRVISLNYDSMLEWFLAIYGFKVRTVYKLPALEGSEDVRIYHPHGYLPHPEMTDEISDFLILGLDSVDTRLGSTGEDPWPSVIRHVLLTGVCLFIGMSQNSARDRALSSIFAHVSKAATTRPVGIWLVADPKDDSKVVDFQRNKICPIYFQEKHQITDFVFKVCQAALNT